MGEPLSLSVVIDERSLDFLAELRMRLSRFYALIDQPLDLVELIRCLPRGPSAIDVQSMPAGGAGERRIVLQFCEPWRELMAALRAIQGNGEFIDQTQPRGSPSVADAAMVNESPPGAKLGGGLAEIEASAEARHG